jgi:3-deoxy-D-manno-octulosonic-acid transferase
MKIRHLYTLLFYLLLPAILIRLLFRSFSAPDYRRRWAERFGMFPAGTQNKSRKVIWVHAVSVGETLAAVPLIRCLQEQHPDHVVMITTTTPTGSAQVKKTFTSEFASDLIRHVYAPYDIPFAINNFLRRANPCLLIIMETELWPNLIHSCTTRHIPVVLANARLSEKSARGYQRLRALTQPMLAGLDVVAVQNVEDGTRFLALGLDKNKLQVTGSIKFDLELPEALREKAAQLKDDWSDRGKHLVWLAASTHAGEDEMILDAFGKLRKAFPSLRLVLVPRHPERFNTMYQQCIVRGFATQRRSENRSVDPAMDIMLGDTMGELLAFYGACDIAFVGGSLVSVGGHNLIEPAAWATPTLTGKHLHNFAEVSALLLQNNALVICDTSEDLHREMLALLSDQRRRRALGNNAQRVAAENRGALHKLLAIINPLLAKQK